VETEWIIVPASVPLDDVDFFPEYEGEKGSQKRVNPLFDVAPGIVYTGAEGDRLNMYKHLFPAGFDDGFRRVANRYHEVFPKDKELTKFEYVRWQGMFIGACQYTQRGRKLWYCKPRGIRPAPNYKDLMPIGRFERIRSVISWCFADTTRVASDPWWLIRLGVDGFNENRARTVVPGLVLTIDELMIAFQPRTTKTGGLPHLSFIKRKPRPLGTEMKCAACGRSGVMLYIEIQEGKDRMRSMPFVGVLKANAACALRVALAAGRNYL